MLNTGIVRYVDKMGRVVIPKELRAKLGVENDTDGFEILVDDDMIILKKYNPACIFCGSIKENLLYEGRNVCRECIEKMYELREGAVD